MDLRVENARTRSARILFNVSDSSLDTFSTPSGHTTSIRNFQLELKKHRRDINIELSRLSKGINLPMLIIFGLYSFTWYLIGIQWLPEPHWGLEIKCNLDVLKDAEWSFYEKRNLSSPKHYHIYEPGCVYYNYNYSSVVNLSYEEAEDILKKTHKHPEICDCVNHTIEVDVPKEVTHIREFELICIKRALQFPKVYVHFGVVTFGFPAGLLGDIYGRRLVNNYLVVLFCISAFVIPFSTHFAMFAAGTFFLGGTLYAVNMLLGLIYCEVFRSKYRAFHVLMAFSWFYVGATHPESIFKLVEVWRLRKLITAISILAFAFGLIMVTPESPRLLSLKRQFKTAWDSLHELGSTKQSNVPNYAAPIINLKYQMKLFSKPYLLHRLYAVIMLNGITTFFYNIFKNTERTILKPNSGLSTEMVCIQVLLMVFTGILTLVHSRKATICIYYILLSLAILTNTLTDNLLIADVAILSGKVFSGILYILTIIYLIEVFPTSHRASSMGLYLTINHMSQGFTEMFIDNYLVSERSTDFLTAFYCGLCMICALISVMIPDTSEDIPDRKEDLYLPLSCDDSSLDIEIPLQTINNLETKLL